MALMGGSQGRLPASQVLRGGGELRPMCTASLWPLGEGQRVVLWLWAWASPSPLLWEVAGGCVLSCIILLEPVGELWPCRDGVPTVDLSLVELVALGPAIGHLIKSKSHIPSFLQTGALTGTD